MSARARFRRRSIRRHSWMSGCSRRSRRAVALCWPSVWNNSRPTAVLSAAAVFAAHGHHGARVQRLAPPRRRSPTLAQDPLLRRSSLLSDLRPSCCLVRRACSPWPGAPRVDWRRSRCRPLIPPSVERWASSAVCLDPQQAIPFAARRVRPFAVIWALGASRGSCIAAIYRSRFTWRTAGSRVSYRSSSGSLGASAGLRRPAPHGPELFHSVTS